MSPIELKGTDNFYLKNEICKANGIKIQTIYQFDFEEENIRVDARLTFTGSGATGSFQQTIMSYFVNTKKSTGLRCISYTACLYSSSLRWKDSYISSGTL